MLIVASDITTEVYYSRVTERFKQAKLSQGEIDADSALQLYAAPLVLGYYAVSERRGEMTWASPNEGTVHYAQASDLVVALVQLEPDEALVQRFLDVVCELIEIVCGPLASYVLGKRSANHRQIGQLLDRACSSVLTDQLPPLLYPERVFLSQQIHKSTMEPLAKLWTGLDAIMAILSHSRVVRSFRLRGNMTPGCIRLLSSMYVELASPTVLFLPTQHGKRMFLAEQVEVYKDINLLVLSPLRPDEGERTVLADLYHWEELLLHLSRHRDKRGTQ